ncbi:hypothetical protein H5410_016146 [Solanum commersonii]|uniref:Uncharacterized protein n=1 Tax=Solanum commersonii TaxID=4109 RepID=A0A9J5ZWI7_SOLCO|nr:hypothetical protein H5410_016146 [Solanum commersonii]
MAQMYGLEILQHKNGCRASTQEQLIEENKYSLNFEPVDDVVPTDKDRLCTDFDWTLTLTRRRWIHFSTGIMLVFEVWGGV